MNQQIYSVSQLTREVKNLLETSFPRLWVEGEISNVKRHTSGHLYFTLKDEDSQIRCAMWRFRASSLLFEPQDGMQVIVEADLQVYERGGNYQLIIQQMQPAGIGSLQMAFEQLKRKLHGEGLFEQSHKKPIPRYPDKIGVITSPTGAAIRDIVSVINRRFPGVELRLYPVRVQGDGAAEEIARAIKDFNQLGEVDVLIVGRGGGSLEDLWAFNEELVARAIFDSKIPIISAVGHEVDFSIADFVADSRAPTPSAAGEMVVRNRAEVKGELSYYMDRFQRTLLNRLNSERTRLENLRKSYAFRKPLDIVYQKIQRLDELQRNISVAIKHQLQINQNKVENLRKHLLSTSPQAIMKRGYSICFKGDEIVKDAAQLKIEDDVRIKLWKGQVFAEVKQTGENG